MGTNGGRPLQERYIPQELLKELSKMGNRIIIGIPCERIAGERRLALTPEAVDMLTERGFRVRVQSGAGLGINYSDAHYSEAGAEIVETPAEAFEADIVLKVLPPLPQEIMLMRPRTTLISMIQFQRFSREVLELMTTKRITAVAYELLSDDWMHAPLLNAISEIEGAAAITIASELLCNVHGGKGILLGGIPGVSPAEIVIIGAGHAGTAAARLGMALGATVKVFDEDINKLRAIQQTLGPHLFTSTFHPNVLHNAFRSADVVIGAMRYINAPHRYVIASEQIQAMKRGSLIIDLRVNQGGCFETTCCLGKLDNELFEQYGVLHYCKPDISNRVARTVSMAFSNIFVPLLHTAGDFGSIQNLVKGNKGFRSGVYLYQGKLVNSYVANHFGLSANDIGLYLAVF